MNGATPGWRPLPECGQCGEPTRRDVHRRNGGYCSSCRPITTEHPETMGARIQLQDWQATVARVRREERARQAEQAARKAARRAGR